jgi:hypothetical protein
MIYVIIPFSETYDEYENSINWFAANGIDLSIFVSEVVHLVGEHIPVVLGDGNQDWGGMSFVYGEQCWNTYSTNVSHPQTQDDCENFYETYGDLVAGVFHVLANYLELIYADFGLAGLMNVDFKRTICQDLILEINPTNIKGSRSGQNNYVNRRNRLGVCRSLPRESIRGRRF